MAPSTKKLNERKVTKYIKQNPYSRRWCCNCHCTGVRQNYHQNIDVDELIWKLLNIQKHNQVTRRTWQLSRRRMPRERNVHYRNLSLSPYERDSISRVSSESGTPSSLENLTEPTDVSSAGCCSSTPNFVNDDFTHSSYVENIGPQCSIDANRALLNKRSIVQIINNYIRAGFEEGKRQAKIYIRKALRFGVKSGYLIPEGQVLKISPTLANSRQIETHLRKRKGHTCRVNDNGLELVQRKIRKDTTLSRNVKNSDESTNEKPERKDLKPKRRGSRKKETKSNGKNSNENQITDDKKDKEKSKNNRRRKKQIKTGRVEKRGRKRQRSVSKKKSSSKKRRSNSKSFEKEENVENDLDVFNDQNNLELNEEKCQNVEDLEDEVKDDSSEFIGCSFSKNQLLADQENDQDNDNDNDDEEKEKCENNEDQVDDSVLKRNEG